MSKKADNDIKIKNINKTKVKILNPLFSLTSIN